MNRKVRLGYWDSSCKQKLYYPGDAHLILTAPAGGGKGRDVIIPALLEYEGSVITVDPKGQNTAVTAHHRAKALGQRVVVLNPFNILPESLAGLEPMGFNPMGILDPHAPSFGADCDAIGEAIVYHEGQGDSHWTDSARQLVSGVVMTQAKAMLPEYRNLIYTYEVISGPRFFEFARQAAGLGDSMIAGRLGRFAANKADTNKELLGIVSTAITQCNFMGNAAIAESLKPSGPVFRFASLRDTPTTVYLILPTRYLSTCAKWFRLVIATAMADLLQEGQGRYRTLALLDEFAQLGTLKVMADVMGIGRGHGIQLFPVLQDLNQLQHLYKDDWQTFLSNAGAQIFFAPRDLKTAEYLSEKSGLSTRVAENRSVSEQGWGKRETKDHFSVSTSYAETPRKLLLPHEVAEMSGREMLVFGENLPGVIRAGRRAYFDMPECRGKYRPDPYHAAQKRA